METPLILFGGNDAEQASALGPPPDTPCSKHSKVSQLSHSHHERAAFAVFVPPRRTRSAPDILPAAARPSRDRGAFGPGAVSSILSQVDQQI